MGESSRTKGKAYRIQIRFPVFSFDILIAKKFIHYKEKLDYIAGISDMLLTILVLYTIYMNIINFVLLILVWYISLFIQNFIFRERPYKYFNLKINTTTRPDHSFPSSHTFIALASAFIINSFIAFLIAIIIILLRVFSLRHWFSDIIFSSLLVACAIFAIKIIF